MSSQLSEIPPGARFRVLGLKDRSDYSAQLLRLGLVPGTEVTVIRRAPLGDPIEVRLRGYSLALRPHEADMLDIEVLS